jgi:Pyruvate/2-oxoacid:ferredoxin oxidoreductase gamma subunit
MTEREVLLTGIGGQGVQLAAQVLAHAAVLEDRHVLLFGVYGGAMRGMNTDGTVVIGDGPIQAPPLISHAWTAIAMHDRYWAPVAPKVRDGGVVVVNDTTFATPLDADRYHAFRVRGSELAAEVGNELAASMVVLGAAVAITGLVDLDRLVAAMRESVPAYRRQHLEVNEAALRAGFGAVQPLTVPAWTLDEVRA